MKILQIQSHPDYTNSARAAVQLEKAGTAALQAKFPDAEIKTLNLYAAETLIPRADVDFVTGKLSAEARAAQATLLADFKAADLIFIYSPLHNFNVTSKMKDYIDNLLIAGETFKYTEKGSVGLLDGHQEVVLALSSGSDYSQDYKYVNMDHAPAYLRTIFALMGLPKLTLIRAQGLDLRGADKAAIIEAAKKELVDTIQHL